MLNYKAIRQASKLNDFREFLTPKGDIDPDISDPKVLARLKALRQLDLQTNGKVTGRVTVSEETLQREIRRREEG